MVNALAWNLATKPAPMNPTLNTSGKGYTGYILIVFIIINFSTNISIFHIPT
jgi:hypothetical protein